MLDLQRCELGVLKCALFKLVGRVGTNIPAGAVFSPGVVARESADGKAFFGNELPELALCFIGEGDAAVNNGMDEVNVCVCLLFSGSQRRETDLLTAFLDGIRLEEVLLRALGDGVWGRFWSSCGVSDGRRCRYR